MYSTRATTAKWSFFTYFYFPSASAGQLRLHMLPWSKSKLHVINLYFLPDSSFKHITGTGRKNFCLVEDHTEALAFTFSVLTLFAGWHMPLKIWVLVDWWWWWFDCS